MRTIQFPAFASDAASIAITSNVESTQPQAEIGADANSRMSPRRVRDAIEGLEFVATGTTTSRTLPDRAVDRPNVLDFGSDSSNYTVKMEAAAEWFRAQALAPATGNVLGTTPVHLHLGTGRRLLEASVNFQQMNDYGWHVDGSGCVINCQIPTKTAFDFLGSRFGKITLNLEGQALIGVQIGRLDDGAGEDFYPAETLSLDIRADGTFGRCIVYNLASETMHLRSPSMLNGDTTGNASILIIDGHNRLQAVTDFEVPDMAQNTALSCIQHTIDACDMRMLDSGTPIRLIGANQVSFRNCYVATPDGYGVEIFDTSGNVRDINLDVHCEGSGLLGNVLFDRISSGVTIVTDFKIKEHHNFADTALMVAASNVTTCRLINADIRIGSGNSGTATDGVFSPAGKFIVDGKIANGGRSAVNCTLFGLLDIAPDSLATAEAKFPVAGSFEVIGQAAPRHMVGELQVRHLGPHNSVTTNQVLTAADSGRSYDNAGATALVTFTLPSAAAGLHYYFNCIDADGITIDADTGDIIRGTVPAGTALSSSAGGTISTIIIGAFVHLKALNATTWQAMSIGGTWTGA